MSTAENEERELRVVLDSNVYVSVFTHPQGLCFQIWSQAVSHRYQFVASPAIVNEVGSVLRGKFGWDDQRIVAHLKLMPRQPLRRAEEVTHLCFPKSTQRSRGNTKG